MWRKVKLARNSAAKQDAYITIGNGQIHFGINACRLMPDCLDKKYVEFFRCDEEYLVGVFVTNEPSEDSIAMQRPKSKSTKKQDTHVNSFTVTSRSAIAQVFGDIGTSTNSVKCKITVDPDTYGMFVVDIRNPRKAKRT